ncbi:MAG TPA: Rrf2 family transcriptional regulator [bacterium]|nr:Rrf2 family transcriptional regulator [bacterium]
MFFSTVCEYGVRALTHLAAYGQSGPVQVKEIAEAEEIPRHFLAKILNQLTYKGLVKATRGPGGGFQLLRPPEEIRIGDVIEAIDGFDAIRDRCVLGLDACSDSDPCPMHEFWTSVREPFLSRVGTLTLASLGDTILAKRQATEPEPKVVE